MIVKPNRDRRTERHEAIRREILAAAWDAAHETSIAGLTLRDIATRVGMQQPSLYSHFASKQAIYDAMFKQAWQIYLDDARSAADALPAEPRPRLIAIAEHYFDFAVADLPRHQLMDVNVVPNFQPSAEAYEPAVQVYDLMLGQLRGIGITRDEDADIYTALLGGLPAEPRARLIAIAEHYFDFAVADLPRHQLMDVNVVPNFQPSPEAYAPAVQAYNLMLDQLRGMGITRDEDADVYTALIGGLVNQQLANDPGGQRWRHLIPRVMSMFADDLGLPS